MTGVIQFYDELSGWGVIVGDDARLYAMRRGHVVGEEPRPGETVRFEPRRAPGGLRAVSIRGARPGGQNVGASNVASRRT